MKEVPKKMSGKIVAIDDIGQQTIISDSGIPYLHVLYLNNDERAHGVKEGDLVELEYRVYPNRGAWFAKKKS